MNRGVFIVLTFWNLFSTPVALAAGAEDLARGRYWHLLLHYLPTARGGFQSPATSSRFFLSPAGKSDPLGELTATVSRFELEAQTPDTHPFTACRFPERFRFLRSELSRDWPIPVCSQLKAWKNKLQAQSATLVYAAAYLGSPASMFGHSFLRLNSAIPKGAIRKKDVLDSVISFEARTGNENPVFYALKGVFGFYPGYFSVSPYHLKINLYSNIESRDLWEYELNLNPEEMDRMLNHLWELGDTPFDYYFFNRNCSYQLLGLLEVAHPDWLLSEPFAFSAIPANTIRQILAQKTAVKSVKVRPSLLRILSERVRRMIPGEINNFKHLKIKNKYSSVADSSFSVRVLDALIDLEKYSSFNDSKTLYDPSQHISPELLLARSQSTDDPDPELRAAIFDPTQSLWMQRASTRPDLGHGTARASVGFGQDSGSAFATVQIRPALHDWMDPSPGYLQYSRLWIGKTVIDFPLQTGGSSAALRIQDLTLAEVASFQPWDLIEHPWSWQLGGGLTRPLDLVCPACLVGRLNGGFGITLPVFPSFGSAVAYGLLNGNVQVGTELPAAYRIGPSIEAGFQCDFEAIGRIQFSGRHFRYFPDSNSWSQGLTEVSARYAVSFGRLQWVYEGTAGKSLPRWNFRHSLQLGVFF